MQLIAYDQPAVFSLLQSEWDDLHERSVTNSIFTTWEWQSSWWSAYDAGQLWVIACRDDEGRLVGLAPWFIERTDQGERVVRTIGCVDVTDYVDVLVEPNYMHQVYDLFAAHLIERRDTYDRINLCNIPEGSPTLELLRASLERCGFTLEIVLQEVCPVIRLPGDWEAYLNELDKKQRHEIRRKIRKAESEAQISWYIVGKSHDIHTELDRFLGLMSASQKQKADFLTNPKNVAFFKTIVPLMFERGWLQLSFLTVNEKTTAAYLNFDYADSILVYNSGLLPDDANLSPGIVLLSYLIQHAIETKHTIFDFLRGNETYKYRMGAQDTRVYKLKAQLSI